MSAQKEKLTSLERGSAELRKLVATLGLELRYNRSTVVYEYRCSPKHAWHPLASHSGNAEDATRLLRAIEDNRRNWGSVAERARALRMRFIGDPLEPDAEAFGDQTTALPCGDEATITTTAKYVVVELRLVGERPLEICERENAAQVLEEAMLERWGSDSIPGATREEQVIVAKAELQRITAAIDYADKPTMEQRKRQAEAREKLASLGVTA